METENDTTDNVVNFCSTCGKKIDPTVFIKVVESHPMSGEIISVKYYCDFRCLPDSPKKSRGER